MPNTLGGDGATEFQGPYAAKHLNSIYKVLQSYNKVGFNKKKQNNQTDALLRCICLDTRAICFRLLKEKKKNNPDKID